LLSILLSIALALTSRTTLVVDPLSTACGSSSCCGAAIDTIDALALALLPLVDSGTLVPQADVSYQSVL
jgi:hypothetical protein